MRLLLRRKDVNPNRLDVWGRAPISWAAEDGNEAMVKLLLGWKGLRRDILDWWKRTPILLAAQNGHAKVVKLLLGRKDVNLNWPDIEG